MKQIELIHTIIETEREAQTLAAEAKEKKLRLREELRAGAETLRKKYLDMADTRIAEVRTQENAFTDGKIREANETHSVEMESLERLYAENRDAWVDKIYALVVDPS